MDHVLITRQALHTMLEESQTCPTETGGILIGIVRRPMVLVAGDPGPQARRTAASFTTDPEHDRQVLGRARRHYKGRVTALGYWHKHPAGLNQPSSGDLDQARKLLADLQASGGASPWLLTFILNPDSRLENSVHAYILWLDAPGFRPLQLVIVEEIAPQVQQALRDEPVYLTPEQQDHPWADPDFRFHLTPVGYQRLEHEKTTLEAAGYRVQARQRRDDQRVSLLVERDGEQMLCVLPVEYPLGMPRLFRLPTGEELYPFRQRPVWNSDLTIADLLSALETAEIMSLPVLEPIPSPTPDICRVTAPHPPLLWLLLAGLVGLGIGAIWGRRSQKAH